MLFLFLVNGPESSYRLRQDEDKRFGVCLSGTVRYTKNVLILLGAIAQSLAICLHAPSLDPVPSGAWVVVFSGHRPFSRSRSRADRPEGADRAGATGGFGGA